MDNLGDNVHKGQTFKLEVGQKGEDLACLFLKKHNFTIISRNYWKKWGEIDIVAQKGNDLRFVEVKTVSRNSVTRESLGGDKDDYEPEDNMHSWKRARLRRVIETYLLEKNIDDDKIDWQVDVISVYINPEGQELKIDWLEDVVL
ncbi:YraN family protein [Candidatus Nomurabacteria bacterium]|nr:YraN family protein [Candidatus Nomurabacteria bacterium]